ncbi:ATP-binding protein [Cellvibrio sp. ARAG 10.3]|uniref:ATP-binding protein n=1 Tax=Cellvibrio sp. ARAG 10.3 TaxID=3451358 RepID=UPI003F479CFA
MIESLSFRTQARTLDHLGREQIADCPTAISELWKNAYDAYAQSVALHIFDDPEPVAVIFDDGHGMSYDEFVGRWLVVGTDSKYQQVQDNPADRGELPKRTKQGQKGIGRLSCANLGPLLLLVSKRKHQDFVAALVDWRIFENPFLVLSDIEVPVTRFTDRDQLFKLLPNLFERLTDNVRASEKKTERSERLRAAWEAYDHVALEDGQTPERPSDAIANTIINARFETRHLESWGVWTGESEQGTALLISDINYDLRAQLPSIDEDGNVKKIRDSFKATLSAFVDPYVDETASEYNSFYPQFSYEVKTWSDSNARLIVDDNREMLSRSVTDEMEHVLSGNVDENGVFRGQVKAFGEWRSLGSDYVIPPPKDYIPPSGPTTFVGPFALYVATYERDRLSSTHNDHDHARLREMPDELTGFLMYRNGLRVLPYGRVDNDFFEIETRRSVSAGREFWNARRMFGRVAISRELNPNLRDKAGREGFIDNRSAKALRTLVIHILRRVAYEYLGQSADLRQELLPDIKERNLKERAEVEKKRLAKKNAEKFRSRLRRNLPEITKIHEETKVLVDGLAIKDACDLDNAQSLINEINSKLSELRITGAPAKLGSSEDDYRQFRTRFSELQATVKALSEMRSEAIERIKPSSPEEIAEKQLKSLASRMHARLNFWRKSITALQQSEDDRVSSLFDERNKAFHALAMPLVEQVKRGRLSLDEALEEMGAIHEKLEAENENTFQSYLDALELMSENINIELIARQGTIENIELKDDLNRLNQLAQLGITVEILGHELNTNERMIRDGLMQIKTLGSIPGARMIETGFEALSQQLEFLSPLKISGSRTRRTITGEEIASYLRSFFESVIKSRNITIEASEDFLRFSITEQPSRLIPVFVNLVNNSVYWLATSRTPQPTIELSVIDEKVVISDNGPGIDPLDQESLFKMFFTRKVSGGRGIGLYLCRVNLMAGGHLIEYSNSRKFQRLSGANFVIDFKGAHFV